MDRLKAMTIPTTRLAHRGLRILLSAYACEPGKGSEPGIGWQWAIHLARAGHEVWVLTRENNRCSIEAACRTQGLSNLHFAYYDLPAWAKWWKRGGRGVHLYYFLWQWGAYRVARQLCQHVKFNLVHHLTFGVFRQPSSLAFLGLPFLFGPLGGGERTPSGLRGGLPWQGRLRDGVRDLANVAARFDPMMHAVWRRSHRILCKTPETLQSIPHAYHEKCTVQLEIATEHARLDRPESLCQQNRGLKVLYVGRLVYLKGLHLAIPAFAGLLRRAPDARFTIVGCGPEEPRLRHLAAMHEITEAIEWIPWMPQSDVMQEYAKHDVFLFPSLHDSSGNAVLEAMSCGLPVVCLALGGPAVLVDDLSGLRVSGQDGESVVQKLADALCELQHCPTLRANLAAGAYARASSHFSWPQQIERMNHIYAAMIDADKEVRQWA